MHVGKPHSTERGRDREDNNHVTITGNHHISNTPRTIHTTGSSNTILPLQHDARWRTTQHRDRGRDEREDYDHITIITTTHHLSNILPSTIHTTGGKKCPFTTLAKAHLQLAQFLANKSAPQDPFKITPTPLEPNYARLPRGRGTPFFLRFWTWCEELCISTQTRNLDEQKAHTMAYEQVFQKQI